MLPRCIQCQRRETGIVHVRQSAAATVFRPVGLCENVLVRQWADRDFAARICRHADEGACEAIAMAVFHRHGRAWSRHWDEMAGSISGSGLATGMTMKKARLPKRNITGQS
jgi:hypothetical protein